MARPEPTGSVPRYVCPLAWSDFGVCSVAIFPNPASQYASGGGPLPPTLLTSPSAAPLMFGRGDSLDPVYPFNATKYRYIPQLDGGFLDESSADRQESVHVASSPGGQFSFGPAYDYL